MAIAFAGLYLLVLLVRKPYRSKGDDRLHMLVQVEIIIILYCGFAFQLPNVANAFYYDALMSVILIAMIGFLALTFAVQFIKFFVKWYV